MTDGIHRATVDDLEPIRALLATSGLPTEDVTTESVVHHWVFRVGATIAGTIALDLLPDGVAVLRSLAVAEAMRNRGLASALYEQAEAAAREHGSCGIYLLTETASEFFSRRAFKRVARADIPPAVATHRQFSSNCCASAPVMVKAFGADATEQARSSASAIPLAARLRG